MNLKFLLACLFGMGMIAFASETGYGDVGYTSAVGYSSVGYPSGVGYPSVIGYQISPDVAVDDGCVEVGGDSSLVPTLPPNGFADANSALGAKGPCTKGGSASSVANVAAPAVYSESSSAEESVAMESIRKPRILFGLSVILVDFSNAYRSEDAFLGFGLMYGYQREMMKISSMVALFDFSFNLNYISGISEEGRYDDDVYSWVDVDVSAGILARYRFSKYFIDLGFSLGYGVLYQTEGDGMKLGSEEDSDLLSSVSCSIPFGVGVDLRSIIIEYRYRVYVSSVWDKYRAFAMRGDILLGF